MSAQPTGPYGPPGQLIRVEGRNQHLHLLGQGSPVVVFEAAVMDFSPTWTLVQPLVAQFTTAVTYDRAGLGWSDPSPAPRQGETFVAELRALLAAAGLTGPYLFVGQSFSGLLVRLYAYLYPSEVAGLVLLDPAHEDQFQRFPAPIQEAFGPVRAQQLQFLRQVAELVATQGPEAAPPLLSIPEIFPPETAAAYRYMSAAGPERLQTAAAELAALETTQAQVRAVRSRTLGELPLIVLSHGVPQRMPGMPDEVNREYEAAWQQMQIEQAAQSTQGSRLVVEEAGHMIQHDRPESVVKAIRQLVESDRAPRGLA